MMNLSTSKTMVTGGAMLGVFLWLALCLGETAALRRHAYYLCPDVTCQKLSSDCQNSELIVFEYNYRMHGRYVNVRCESCPYCTDLPWARSGRGRRAVPRLYDVITDGQQCPDVACPPVAETCDDVRPTGVILRGKHCTTCPACYDHVFDRNDVIIP